MAVVDLNNPANSWQPNLSPDMFGFTNNSPQVSGTGSINPFGIGADNSGNTMAAANVATGNPSNSSFVPGSSTDPALQLSNQQWYKDMVAQRNGPSQSDPNSSLPILQRLSQADIYGPGGAPPVDPQTRGGPPAGAIPTRNPNIYLMPSGATWINPAMIGQITQDDIQSAVGVGKNAYGFGMYGNSNGAGAGPPVLNGPGMDPRTITDPNMQRAIMQNPGLAALFMGSANGSLNQTPQTRNVAQEGPGQVNQLQPYLPNGRNIGSQIDPRILQYIIQNGGAYAGTPLAGGTGVSSGINQTGPSQSYSLQQTQQIQTLINAGIAPQEAISRVLMGAPFNSPSNANGPQAIPAPQNQPLNANSIGGPLGAPASQAQTNMATQPQAQATTNGYNPFAQTSNDAYMMALNNNYGNTGGATFSGAPSDFNRGSADYNLQNSQYMTSQTPATQTPSVTQPVTDIWNGSGNGITQGRKPEFGSTINFGYDNIPTIANPSGYASNPSTSTPTSSPVSSPPSNSINNPVSGNTPAANGGSLWGNDQTWQGSTARRG